MTQRAKYYKAEQCYGQIQPGDWIYNRGGQEISLRKFAQFIFSGGGTS